MKISAIIRWILTAGLLYLVFLESGPWTMTALALCAVGVELEIFLLVRLMRLLREALE